MTITRETTLIPLKGSDVPIHASMDIRGFAAFDSEEVEIGKVEDLIVDPTNGTIRMLKIRGGGVLGVGGHHWFVPVEAITDVTDDAVHVDRAREQLLEGEDQGLQDNAFVENLYSHYGATPFWTPGYRYPDWRPLT
jgi:sporulation protein YlmC with PRC-barrel domain